MAEENFDDWGFDDITPKDELEAALAAGEKSLIYPKNLVEIDHWMCFRVNAPVLRKQDDFPISQDKLRIFLPMPLNLQTQYGQTYNAEGLGVAGMAGASLGAAGLSGGVKGIIDTMANVARKDVVDAGVYYALQGAEEGVAGAVGAAVGGIGAGIIGAAAGKALKGAIAGAGVARNPYMAMLYDSPQFRTHQFSWKLVARNPKETYIIKKIIYAFKYHSAPNKDAKLKHFFDYPEQFDIDFHYDKFLYNIGPSVCTSFEVNYHSEGQPLYTVVDGTEKAPLSVTITGSFQEVSIITKKEIKDYNR